MTSPRVIIANVAKNHGYPIAEAAAQAGYLKRFVTSVYYKPDRVSGRVAMAAASRLGSHERHRLEGRRSSLIPDDLVVSLPASELFEQAVARAGRRFHLDDRPATYVKNAWFDRAAARHVDACDIFHGFEQCALSCLKRAHELRATTVLDQPIMHIEALLELERDECARFGATVPVRPLGFDAHVTRKHAEYASADYFFVGLDFVKRTFVERGHDPDRIFVIPYGTDVRALAPVDRRGRSTFEILYVGPVHYWKGLHYLLEAFAGLDVPNARLTIVGRQDPDWTPRFAPRLQALGDRVRVIPGVPHAELATFYAAADVLAFPSMVGGIGLVCYEAMASGLPILTSDGDVVLTHEESALCQDPRDVMAWRRAIERLHRDEDLRARIGRAGHERLAAFSWEVYRREIVAAYDRIAMSS